MRPVLGHSDVVAGAVQIGVQGPGRWLGFDLAEVIEAIGDHSHLAWALRNAEFNGDVRPVWPAGPGEIQARSTSVEGVPITWIELLAVSRTCRQIIDGTFVGFDQHGAPVVSVAAIDSSYWIVWALDASVLVRVRAAFDAVVDYPEPAPPRRDRPPDDPARRLSDEWRTVWGTTDALEFDEELKREVPVGHVLDDRRTETVAVKRLRKESIHWLTDDRKWAVVHFTWTVERDPRWPSIVVVASWTDVLGELDDRG